MEKIVFEIYGIPVAKGRPRFALAGKFPRAYTPGKTRDYEENILAQALKYKPGQPIDTAVEIDLTFFMPIPASMSKKLQVVASETDFDVIKKPDLDNLIKAALDPLNGVFWTDDSRISRVSARKLYSRNPRVRYVISYDGGVQTKKGVV